MTTIRNEIRNAIVFVVAVLITSAIMNSTILRPYTAPVSSHKVVPPGHKYRTTSAWMDDQIIRALMSIIHTLLSRLSTTCSIVAFSLYVWENESVQLNATVFREVRIRPTDWKIRMVFAVLNSIHLGISVSLWHDDPWLRSALFFVVHVVAMLILKILCIGVRDR